MVHTNLSEFSSHTVQNKAPRRIFRKIEINFEDTVRRNSGRDGTVTVRNLADTVWRRTWVPSFGSTSIADIRNTSGRPSLCGDLHAAEGGAVGHERRSLGRQLSLSGGGSAGVL
ncbi:hypothetical protein Zmor_020584 [Zophobas morio]|uniref:Uncharacterized protein n=1 Tax=Zophobas morio TaxID=2755281 RepID=A0AA38I3P5_9CUCU|nr:hypothetical protein Zmor_020584 [Zophobas morio]